MLCQDHARRKLGRRRRGFCCLQACDMVDLDTALDRNAGVFERLAEKFAHQLRRMSDRHPFGSLTGVEGDLPPNVQAHGIQPAFDPQAPLGSRPAGFQTVIELVIVCQGLEPDLRAVADLQSRLDSELQSIGIQGQS